MIGLFTVLFFLLGKVYDAFWMSLQRISELLYGQILAAMATDGILYIVICLMSRRLCNILPGIAAIAGQDAPIAGISGPIRLSPPQWSTMFVMAWKSSSMSTVFQKNTMSR